MIPKKHWLLLNFNSHTADQPASQAISTAAIGVWADLDIDAENVGKLQGFPDLNSKGLVRKLAKRQTAQRLIVQEDIAVKIDLLNNQPNRLFGLQSGRPIESPPVLNLATEIYAKPISPIAGDFHSAFLPEFVLFARNSKNPGIPRSVQTNRVNFRTIVLATQ